MHTHTNVHTHTKTYTCTHECTHAHAHKNIHMHTRMHTCTHAHTQVPVTIGKNCFLSGLSSSVLVSRGREGGASRLGPGQRVGANFKN